MKILVVKEKKGYNQKCFTLPYNKLSQNILKHLYPIYKDCLVYIVKEYKWYSSDIIIQYKPIVILTYDEFLNSEV